MTAYRVYANGTVVHEDDFDEWDNAQPYYDDYAVYTVPDDDEDAEYWDIPSVLLEHIVTYRDVTTKETL